MNTKHNNQPNKFEPGKGNGLNAHEAPIVREVLVTVDAATGAMFVAASRYTTDHGQYHSNPPAMSGSAFVIETAAAQTVAHDDLGQTAIQRTAEIDQMNAAFDAPAAVNETDLDLAAIRARIEEVRSNA